MKQRIEKRWVALLAIMCMILSNIVGYTGELMVSKASAVNLLSGIDSTMVTPARAWIDANGIITAVGSFGNSNFDKTKMNTVDETTDTHVDIPGGWDVSAGGYHTLGIKYDLGESKDIAEINITGFGIPKYYISGVRVFISETGEDWYGKSALIVDETNDDIGKENYGGVLQETVMARYIMIIVTSYISTAGQPRVAEVEIKGYETNNEPIPGPVVTTYKVENIIDYLKLNGRTTSLAGDIKNGLDLDWSASGVSFDMTANEITDVTFNFSMYSRSSNDPSVYFTIYVDGSELKDKRYGITASSATTTKENLSMTIENLAVGNHTIEIYKQTENKSGECTLKTISMNGTIGTKPVERPLKMEIIGDSVVAGYGNLGTKSINTDAIGSSPLYQDALQTFGALSAQELNADLSILGMSGISVACGNSEKAYDYIMPDYYHYANYARYSTKWYNGDWLNWNFETGSDIVIVNLGANDWNRHKTTVNGQEVWNDSSLCGVTYEEVGERILAFLRTVREKNPNAEIIWTYGMTGFACRDKVQVAVNTLKAEGDNKVSYLDLQAGQDGVDGANGHPSVDEHVQGANVLLAHIESLNNPALPSTEARLDSISYNNIELSNFASDVLTYEVKLPYNATIVPTVTVTKKSSKSNVQITNATKLDGTLEERTTLITVTAEDNKTSIVYKLIFSLDVVPSDNTGGNNGGNTGGNTNTGNVNWNQGTQTGQTLEVEGIVLSEVRGSGTDAIINLFLDANRILAQAVNATIDNPLIVKIEIPKNLILEQLKVDGLKNVSVTMNIPTSISKNSKININEIMLLKEILEATKKAKANLSIDMIDEKGNINYQWSFSGTELDKSVKLITNVNLSLTVKSGKENEKLKTIIEKDTKNKDAILLDFKSDDKLPAKTKISFYVGNQDAKEAKNIHFVKFNNETDKYETIPYGSSYNIDTKGYITLEILSCTDYVILENIPSNSVVSSLRSRITAPVTESLTIGQNKKLEVSIPDTLEIVKSLESNKNTDKIGKATVSYSVSNTNIASISEDGVITAKKAGKATITTTVVLYSGKKKVIKTVVTIS